MNKKIALAFIITFLCVSGAWAQGVDPPVSIEDALKKLDDNFDKYPYAYLILMDHQTDNRPTSAYIRPASYEGGEYLTVEIIRNGVRFDIKLDHLEKKLTKSLRSQDARRKVHILLTDVYSSLEREKSARN